MVFELHKEFYRSLFKPTFSVPAYRSALGTYRRLIEQAQRFVLDSRMLEEVADRSGDLERMMDRVQTAHLPFDTIWIEYDNIAKLRFAAQRGRCSEPGDETAPQAGFLVTRHEGRPDAWIATKVMNNAAAYARKNISMPLHGISPVSYIVDLASTTPITQMGPYRSLSALDVPSDCPTVMRNVYERARMGQMFDPFDVPRVMWGIQGRGPNDPLDEAANKASPAVTPMVKALIDAAPSHKTAVWANALAEGLIENMGDMRFIVTALAMINHVPVEFVPVTNKSGSFAAGGHLHQYLTHRTVRIDFNRVKRLKIGDVLHKAAIQARRRAHMVRRYYWTSEVEPLRNPEKWEKFIDEDGKQKWRRWIEAHSRGDASLGWVNKDYEVTA